MSADALSPPSRAFYEQTKYKFVLSVFLFSLGILSLAFNCYYSGEANAAYYRVKAYDHYSNDDKYDSGQNSLRGGYGFGAFCVIVAAILLWIASIYYSPMCCGSLNERKTLNKPEEIGTAPSASTDSTVSPMASIRDAKDVQV